MMSIVRPGHAGTLGAENSDLTIHTTLNTIQEHHSLALDVLARSEFSLGAGGGATGLLPVRGGT